MRHLSLLNRVMERKISARGNFLIGLLICLQKAFATMDLLRIRLLTVSRSTQHGVRVAAIRRYQELPSRAAMVIDACNVLDFKIHSSPEQAKYRSEFP